MPSSESELMRKVVYPAVLAGLFMVQAAQAQSLQDTIANALAQAPAIAEADASAAAASARLDRAQAESNPLLRVDASAGVGRIDHGGFFGMNNGNTNPLAVQATAEMPLYAGGRISAAIAQSRQGAELAKFGAEQARLDTVVQAVSIHSDVLTMRKLEQSYARLAANLGEMERQAMLRFNVGEISSADLAQVRARKAEAQSGLAQAQGRRISVEAAFERLTGQTPGALEPLAALPPVPPSLGEALDLARQNNPALHQAKAQVKMAEAGVRRAKAEGLPSVGAFAEGSYVRDQFFLGYKADAVTVGVRGRWNLWSGGRVSSQTRAANADLSAAESRQRRAEQALDGMVIDTWHDLNSATQAAQASELRHSAAREALRGIKLEAQVGAKPTLAVLDAEREAIAAEADLLAAEAMRAKAAWQLGALTGTLPPQAE